MLERRPDATFAAATSNLAFVPRADFPSYRASKAFLHPWLQSMRHQLRRVPAEVLELAPPYVGTELTGSHRLSDPRALPLADCVAEVMAPLAAGDHPRGVVPAERDRGRRSAERDGRYGAVYAAIDPA